MCGICGRIAPGGTRPQQLAAMMAALRHRGPDDEGTYLEGPAALGHRRLSIIDLTRGHQPITNEDGTLWIVFNGEIYNYGELRPGLLERGHRFTTDSDTEVILHLYEEYGPACVERLRGMFAFAIWDERSRRLFAARDRLGQKPFYYAHGADGFLFGSEIKALLAADSTLATPDLAALDQYLTLRLVAPPRSMFQQVRKLPPAHWLSYELGGEVRVQRYWDLSYEPKLRGTEEDLLEELERRLLDCFRHHLVSDVPVGAFMSGGLDSTLIVAMIARHGLAKSIDTFSVGLPYGDYDEAPYAKLVAERYGTTHHEQVITPSLLDTLPQLVAQLDEPSDPLAVCQFLISRFARRHVKVVLGGEGGDELFGGYDRYYGNLYAGYYAWLPEPLRRWIIGPSLHLLPDGQWYKSRAHQLKWMHEMAYYRGGVRYARSLGYFYFPEAMRSTLYGAEMIARRDTFDADAALREPYEHAAAKDALDRMLSADSQVRLPDHPVMILDRMTMAHGLEARAPFMDHELAEFAARLPARLKVRGRRTRLIQRRLAERYLPPELLRRPKQGFQSALPYMLRDEYRLLFRVFLEDSILARHGLLRQAPIDALLAEHLAGRVDHGNRLWLLLNSELWFRIFIERETVGSLEERIDAETGRLTARTG